MPSKYYVPLFVTLFTLTLHQRAAAQFSTVCVDPYGDVVINEIGIPGDVADSSMVGAYIELLVVGNNPLTPVDLRGVIIDDNNVVTGNMSVTPGHIELGDCFSEIMPGTIILLYDELRPGNLINSANDGAPNSMGVYQVPFSSPCLEKFADCPTSSSSSYNCGESTYGGGPEDWEDYLKLDQLGDKIQVIGIQNQLLHSVSWVNVIPSQQTSASVGDSTGQSVLINFYEKECVSEKCIFFTQGSRGSLDNYLIGTFNYTPGVANTAENAAYINALRPSVCAGNEFLLGCPDNPDYCYVWSPAAAIQSVQDGQALVSVSDTTVFRRTVLDGDGNIVQENTYTVNVIPSFDVAVATTQMEVADCPLGANFLLEATVSDSEGGYTYAWSTGENTASVTLPGGQTYSLTVTAPNGCTVVKEISPVGDPTMTASVAIVPSMESFCGESPLQLTAELRDFSGAGDRTYNWSNGATTSVTEAPMAGEYRVTVTTTAGCEFYDTIQLEQSFDFSIFADSEQACPENPVTLGAGVTIGGVEGLIYQWSTGEITPEITVTEGGTYAITVTNLSGCSLTRVYALAGGVEMQLMSAAERLSPNGSVMISPEISGGSPPYTYQWSSGSVADILDVNVAGTYTLTVTDNYGCTATDEAEILPYDNSLCEGLAVSLLYRDPDCAYGGNAMIESLVTGGFEISDYNWSTGEDSPDIMIDQGNTTYDLTVSATNGCTHTISILVPDFTSLNSADADVRFCPLVDHLEIVSLAEDQAILVFENLSQADLDNFAGTDHAFTFEVVAEYENEQGEVKAVVPLSGPGNRIDPTTWAGDLFEIPADTDVEVHLRLSSPNYCPVDCGQVKLLYNPGLTDSVEVVLEEDPEIRLTDYDCGDTYVPDDMATNNIPLASLNVGELIQVYGFPVLVSSVNTTENFDGNYEGEGIMPLPFNDRTLKILFSGTFNKFRVMTAGTAEGLSDDLANYDFSMDTLFIGGEICIPRVDESGSMDGSDIDTVGGLDSWGFNAEGIHSVTGEPYDENGFDANGLHRDTGTEYSPAPHNCSREGRDPDGNPCNPSYVNPATQAFMDSVEAGLPVVVANLLADTLAFTQQLLQQQQQVCTGIRADMNTLIGQLQFDEKFIKGDSSQYFDPGLSERFSQKPEAFVLNVPRNPLVESLEVKHIALDTCDRKELEYLALEAAIAGADAGAVVAFLLNEISYLSEEDSNALRDPDAFLRWLKEKLQKYFAENPTAEELGVFTPFSPAPSLYTPPTHDFHQLGTFAGESLEHFGSREEMLKYELNSQFRQGFREIQGVHRAHFLAKIAELREEEETPAGKSLLPIAITKYVGGLEYSILLDAIQFSANSAPTLNAYLVIEDPESGQKLVFETLGAAFGPGGMSGDSRLQLSSNVAIRLNNAAKLILSGDDRTYVDWGCDGFTGLAIGGSIELCRNLITPLDANTLEPLPDPERFRLDFDTYVPEWLDVVVKLNANPFAITGNENIKWRLDSMVVDLSDRITPQFVPTEGYASQHYGPDGMSPQWRGFYAENLSATLPNDFSTDDTPITVGVEDVLIDGTGFSGEVYAEGQNLLDFATGSAGGWPFSIDRFYLKVLHNRLAGGGFGGLVNVPVFEENLVYDATVYTNNRYKFTVRPDSIMTMDMLLAQVDLHPCSKVEIGYDYDGFLAVASLTGDLRFAPPDTASFDFTLPELYFKDFRVSNRNPYFDAGTWEMKNVGVSMDFGGFEMDLSGVAPYRGESDREAGVGFDLAVKLAPGVDELSAFGRFGVLGELEEIDQRQRWKFKRLDLDGFAIDANIKDVVHVKGALRWFDEDPTHGKGFFAMLSADFKKKPLEFKADVAGQFGKKDGTNYFFIDAMIDAGQGIPVGPLNIDGFGGGLSYHMRNEFTASALKFADDAPLTSMPTIGTTFSGTQYFFDPSIGLGLKATVMLATKKEEIFNGWAGLELAFNSAEAGGGLNKISFKGQGQFMAVKILQPPPFLDDLPPKLVDAVLAVEDAPDLSPGNTIPISAWIDLTYNFSDKVFDGTLEAYMDMYGILTGAGDNNRLVQAAIHAGPEKWYINVGTPANPCGVEVNLPLFNASATAYFNMGTDIPDFPGLPDQVKKIANLYNTNEALRKSGGGIMFGAALDAEARLKAGPVQGFLNAGLGFDLMLRDYGNAVCESGQRIGVNGWYAAGQAWVYLEGGVKLFGIPIFEAGVAGIMQARMPNPFWAKATLAARVKLLFVQKRINLNVEIGEQCSLLDENGQAIPENPVINYLDPFGGAKGVAPDAKPTAFFSVPINKVFTDENGEQFTAKLTKAELTSLVGGYRLAVEEEILNEGTTLRLTPSNFFTGSDSVRFEVEVTTYQGNSVVNTESETVVFYVGDAYEEIPTSNIAYSYPTDGMYDFYPQEYNRHQGFIQLKSGQQRLLEDLEPGESNKIQLIPTSGTPLLLDASYDNLGRLISFPLPPEDLTPGLVYEMKLVRQKGKEVISELLAGVYFRVSQQQTFMEKLSLISNSQVASNGRNEAGYIARKLESEARIGDVARLGTVNHDPLVRFSADLDNPYVQDYVNDLYDVFPVAPLAENCRVFDHRPAGEFDRLIDGAGVAPVTAASELIITSNEFTAASDFSAVQQHLRYEVQEEIHRHHRRLRSLIANCLDLNGSDSEEDTEELKRAKDDSDWIQYIGSKAFQFYQNSTFIPVSDGTYRIRVGYYLPNDVQTSSGSVTIPYYD